MTKEEVRPYIGLEVIVVLELIDKDTKEQSLHGTLHQFENSNIFVLTGSDKENVCFSANDIKSIERVKC